MKKENIILLIITVLFLSCKSDFLVIKSSKITYENEPGFTNKKVGYFHNDSLHLKLELESIDFLNLEPVNPLVFDNVQRYILKKNCINRKNDIILYSNDCEIIVLRKTTPKLKNFRAYSVFDTTISKVLNDNTVKKIYRKTRVIKKRKLYIIEDVFQTIKSTYSFIYFGQNETKGGRWFIDPTDLDDILYYTSFYKHTLEVSKKNAIKIMEQEIKDL